MRIVILDGYTLNPGDLSWDALRQMADVEVHERTPEADVVDRASDAEIVLTNKTPLSSATLAQLPKLKYIGVLATGYNIVDTAAARERGVVVSNIPTYGTASVAQFAIALLLELCHHIGLHGEAVRSGEWSRNPDWCFWKTPLIELSGRTLGILGFGRIGRQTAAIGAALGMRILANDANEANAPDYPGFAWKSVDDLICESDVVSLHCPLFADNKGMMHRERLAQMKRSAFLLNTSRGPLVVDQDLADALNNGVIAGAGLDVLSVEPPVASNPLLSAKNCIVTPHIAWATKEARSRLLDTAVENVKAFLAGRVQNAV
ncbi:MAG TPA: D-2-hydroxyacid dehydrogenase [Bryobacteraceae bacterium]|nr:D-2-hydroxyacid dehydrogenase [Bryobacteraceae bacterium]